VINKIEPIKLYMYLYVFLLPWNFFNGMFSNLTIVMLIWWLIIGKKEGYFSKLKTIFYNKALTASLFFVLYTWLSLLWSDHIEIGLKELNYYKFYIIIILVFFSVFNKNDVKIAFYVLVFSFGLYAIFSLMIYLELFSIKLDKGKISNENDPRGILPYAVVTFYMGLGAIYAIYFFIKEINKKLKYLFLFISIICFCALIVNNGRMAQVSFIITTIILLIYNIKHLYKYKKILISSVLIIILGIFSLYNSNKLDRYFKGINELQDSYENKIYEGSWGARLFFIKAGIELIPKNLLFGAGVGDGLYEFKEYQKENKEVLKHRIVSKYHNQHLDLLANFGIFGYLIFLMSILILLSLLYKEEKYFFILGFSFFLMFIFTSFGDSMLQMKTFNNMYILIFVLLSLVTNRKENRIEH